jgi:hypothetical protein
MANSNKGRKFFATAATAALVASAIVPVASASTDFADSSSIDSWAKDSVDFVVERGLMKGVDGNKFDPKGYFTRAQAAQVIVNYLGLDTENTTAAFADVKEGDWYYGAVNAAAEAGAVNGVGGGKYDPTKNLTRQDAAKIFGELLGLDKSTADLSELDQFNDASKIADYAKEYVAIFVAADVINGKGTGFDPTGLITRQELAKIIALAIQADEAGVFNPDYVGDLTDALEAVKEAYGKLVEKVTADNIIAAKDAVADTKEAITAAEEALEAAKEADVLTEEEVKLAEAAIAAAKAAVAKAETAVAEYEETLKEFKVESVKAVNGKTLEIKFAKAVKESSVITTVSSVDYLNASNFTITTLDGKAITLGTTSSAATAELSEDGKTLTVTAGDTEVFEGRYQVVINNIQDLTSVTAPKFDQVIDLGKDTVAPSIASTTKVNANKTKVVFSESVTLPADSVTYKLADGTVVPTTDITIDSVVTLPATDKAFTFTVAAGKYVGKTITATIIGAQDAAGNLLTPNPSTFSIQVGDKDGVAPTVTSVTATNDTQFVVTFSEEVQGFAAANFTLTGNDIASLGTPTVVQDSTDKKKWTVTYPSSVLATGKTTTVADVAVAVAGVTDLSGEAMTAAYSQIVSINKDTVAPKLVSSSVITEAGVKYLLLNFDEKLSAVPTVTSASSYKDYVTTSGTVTFNTTLLSADGKTAKIALEDATTPAVITGATFTPTGGSSAALVAGTKYTVRFNATDASSNTTTTPLSVDFTYEATTSSDKPVVETTPALTGQSTVAITFDREIDGATATNAANYSIAGVAVKSATLAAVSSGKQTVTLTLDANDLTGNRAITIANVKSKAGVAMDTFTGIVSLTENVKPEVKSAKITGTTTIQVTFSEAIQSGFATNDDFVLKVGSTTIAATDYSVAAVTGDATKATITLTTALTAANLAETITLETIVSTSDAIKDLANNTVKAGTVTVAKN